MRKADAITLLRVALVLAAAYMVILRLEAPYIIAVIAVAFALDAVDGFFAAYEAGAGKLGVRTYVAAALGDTSAGKLVRRLKSKAAGASSIGPRIDVAGDRVAEYTFWVLFTYLHIIPLILTLLIVVRHSFADALMAARGTSSKMGSGWGRALYASNASRLVANLLKFLAFAYLTLAYISEYPMWIGYVVVGALFAFVMLRGFAEVVESLGARHAARSQRGGAAR